MAGLDILTPLSQGLQIRGALQQQQLQREQAGRQAELQPLQLQQAQLGLQQATAEAESLQNLAPFAAKLTQVSDAGKLDALMVEKQNRNKAGIATPILDEGIALAQAGDFTALNQSLNDVIQGGQPIGGAIKSFAPVQTTSPTGEVGLGIPQVDPQGNVTLEPLDLGGVSLSKETPKAKREADLQAAITKKQGELIASDRQRIKTEITSGARTARRQIKEIGRIEDAFSAIETGKIAQATRLLGPFIPGVDPTDEQAVQASINKLVMNQIGNLPGALSEKELTFAQEATANLGFTREANLIIIKRLKRAQQDLVDEEKQFKEFTKGGGKPEDFEFDISGGSEALTDIAQREQAIEDAPEQAKEISDQVDKTNLTPNQTSIIEQLRAAGATEEEINAALGGQ